MLKNADIYIHLNTHFAKHLPILMEKKNTVMQSSYSIKQMCLCMEQSMVGVLWMVMTNLCCDVFYLNLSQHTLF